MADTNVGKITQIVGAVIEFAGDILCHNYSYKEWKYSLC